MRRVREAMKCRGIPCMHCGYAFIAGKNGGRNGGNWRDASKDIIDNDYSLVIKLANGAVRMAGLMSSCLQMEGGNMYIAHKRADGAVQLLRDHLQGVGKLAADFALPFGGENHVRRIAQLHDLGKYSPAGQRRMMDPEHVCKVDHSTAGAKEASSQFRDIVAALAIAGHHGGLPDLGNAGDANAATLMGRLCKDLSGDMDYSAWKSEIIPDKLSQLPSWLDMRNPWQLQFYTRMAFSCLVDADFLDTERFMHEEATERSCGAVSKELLERLRAYVAPWLKHANSPISERRNAILSHCLTGNEMPRGMYMLTVPTGGGKTVSSMAFALSHAVRHGLKRIIYVIPYTSIIEQNAAVFADILGAENVLEHHSGVDYPLDMHDGEDEGQRKKQLATENWDAPVVVTTAVQFFESLFANRTGRCRKLHNLADSVIIFDEAQMIPPAYLRPCVAAIAELVQNYGVSAVLCTATQPSLEKLIHEFAPGMRIQELCPDLEGMQKFFSRVCFVHDGKLSDAQLAENLAQGTQSLCIVNTRKRAREIYALLPEDGRYHLSTLMTALHRSRVLNEIRFRLEKGLACRVVSTSLIEAGVDVDFPEVWREEAGLDSVLQAAGRCNREGKRPREACRVHVFRPDGKQPMMMAQNIAAMEFAVKDMDTIASYDTIRRYFDFLHKLRAEYLDEAGILEKCKRFQFRTAADAFHLIGDDTVAVYIPDNENEELLNKLRRGEISRALLRRLGRSAVNVYRNQLRDLQEAGKLENCDGFYILTDPSAYDADSGLILGMEAGAALWI